MKYIALTLGPITRTIEMAENTRGLWAASYLFSYLGKKLIEPYRERNFLLPYIPNQSEEGNKDTDNKDIFKDSFNGAGVFPDRYIFEAEEHDFDTLSKHVGKVIHELAADIKKLIGYNEGDIENFLKKYLKVYFFEKDFNIDDKKNIKASCEKALSLLEMQDPIIPKEDDSRLFLNRLFERVTSSFLAEDAGLKDGFPTIVKVSSGDNVEMPKQPYQRYVAIVKADGDSMGKAFEEATDSNKLSQALLVFNQKAVKIIHAYNGLPVYIGGDDLLFFAPVYTTVKTTEKERIETKDASLFSLLQDLDNAFHSCIALTKLKNHPTLSFGVSITYYKYPMFEALKLAEDLLSKAKANAANNPKNNIVYSVQKHSGQTRAALLHKGNTKTLVSFNSLVDDYMTKIKEEDKKDKKEKDDKKPAGKQMLASVMHGLREKEQLLYIAIKEESTITNFFKNNFNEPVHKNYGKFFEDIKGLLRTSYQEFSQEDKLKKLRDCLPKSMMTKDVHSEKWIATPEKAAIETAYNALQFIHLINQRNDEREDEII